MEEVVKDVFSMLNDKASKKNISLDFEQQDNVTASIETDKLVLKQILINLVGNCIKFTGDGGAVKVTLAHYETNHGVKILVQDSGMAIPRES